MMKNDENARQDERKRGKIARVWGKVLIFAADYENKMKNMIKISNVGAGIAGDLQSPMPARKNAEE